MRSFFLFIVFIVFSPSSYSAESGPFGLVWGMKESDIRSKGVKLERKSSDNNLERFNATSLPKNLSMSESYALIVHSRLGLQKVVMLSKDITGDVYGSEGKEAFADLKGKLTSKYGDPTNGLERVGMKLYEERDEFYQCLAYDGCGIWVALFEDKSQEDYVALALKGLGRGKGYIELTYEGPRWSDAVKARKSDISKSDADAL